MPRSHALAFILVAFSGLPAGLFACGSSDSSVDTGPVASGGGPVAGPADSHCHGVPVEDVEPATCMMQGESDGAAGGGGTSAGGTAGTGAGGSAGAAGSAVDGAGAGDAGTGGSSAADCNQTHDPDYGATMFGAEGDDDDCKYHVVWSSTPVAVGQDVTFTVKATSKANGKPLEPLAQDTVDKTAMSRLELYIPCEPTHPPPAVDANPTITETAPGTYQVTAQFDKPGRWAARFHFYEGCFDHDHSPHGHAAFFVDVPNP